MYRYSCPAFNNAPLPMCYYCMQSKININDQGNELESNHAFREKGKPKPKQGFTLEEAVKIGKKLGIDWNTSKFDAEQYRIGLNTELEHGMRDPTTNVTNNDPYLTGKIALAHLNEFPDYYTRLSKLEAEAKAYWGIK